MVGISRQFRSEERARFDNIGIPGAYFSPRDKAGKTISMANLRNSLGARPLGLIGSKVSKADYTKVSIGIWCSCAERPLSKQRLP